ncbi:MAG: hypothetical protein H0X03_09380 [Nitrosopumilus sp.]|nr:hypothetical protein [Nitrosopumilus sp.]
MNKREKIIGKHMIITTLLGNCIICSISRSTENPINLYICKPCGKTFCGFHCLAHAENNSIHSKEAS